MQTKTKEKLLKNPEVVEEVKRHCWIESEKVGHDIGFDHAATDWINRFADNWIKEHEAPRATKTKTTAIKTTRAKASSTKKTASAAPKKRRAKSYKS